MTASQAELDAIADQLRTRLATLQAGIARLEVATTQKLSAGFADQAQDIAELATNEGLDVLMIHEAEQIMAALGRLAAGDYGVCSNCGADIGHGRLAALPTATRCIKCAA
jgi:RNA polymerase-binding transcription factor DksA